MGRTVKQQIILLVFLFAWGLLLSGCKNEQVNRNPYGLALVTSVDDYRQQVSQNPLMQMVDLEKTVPGVLLDIRYATTNNFTSQVVYSSARAFARKPVADALVRVQDSLASYHLGLKIYDAYRPYAATLKFYEVYPDTSFVANPRHGSRHNRGCAVDVSLVDLRSKTEIAMPSSFDEFSEKAHPEYMQLPDTVIANRQLLFNVMEHFGFSHYPTEWWHFDYRGWEDFPLMDLSFDELDAIQ